MMRSLLTGLTVLSALLGVCGCGGGGGAISNNPGSNAVTINAKNDATAPMGFSFDSPVSVHSGQVVQWNNTSGAPHNIVWDSVSPASSPAPGANIGTFAAGAMSSTWTAPTVTVATTYNYHCGIHGPTMAGVIDVSP